jgi:trk system potassium uptake protein TrkA
MEAGITDAGAFAAVTSGDNSNIMSARVARETFGIERVVARIYDPRRAVIYQRLGIPTVATVSWTTDQVIRRLLPDERPAEWVDASSQVCLVERDLPAAWAGRRLADLAEPSRFNVVSITRMGNAKIPSGDLIGQEGDVLHFIVATEDLPVLDERLTETDDVKGHH